MEACVPTRRQAIEQILARADLAEILVTNGRQVQKKHGMESRALCPFHDDHHPSLYLYPGRGGRSPAFHCFTCQAHGDCFALVKQLRSCDFTEALTWLAEHTGVHVPITPRGARARGRIGRNLGLALALAAYRRESASEQEQKRSWAALRGLDVATLEKAGVFCVQSPKLAAASASWDREEQDALEAAGVITGAGPNTPGSTPELPLPAAHRDFFWGARIVFTLQTTNSAPLGFIARALEDGQSPKYLFSKGAQRAKTLYGIDRAHNAVASETDGDEIAHIYVVEGPVDALRLEQHGVVAVAAMGAHLSADQVRLLADLGKVADSRHRQLWIHLFLDGDDAGRRGTERSLPFLLKTAAESGTFLVDVVLPGPDVPGKDPDELLRSQTSRKGVEELLARWAVPAPTVLMASALGCRPDQVSDRWRGAGPAKRLRAMRVIEQALPAGHGRAIAARTFTHCNASQPEQPAPSWFLTLKRYLGEATEPEPDLQPETIGEAGWVSLSDVAVLSRATRIARASMTRREVPVDDARWERLQRAPDLFAPAIAQQLRLGVRQLEPFVGGLVPKSAGKEPRLKAVPCPEDLTAQQYLMSEILRSRPSARGFQDSVPAVRYWSGGTQTRLETTGLGLRKRETVSFAYQVDMAVLDLAVEPTRHGMFRDYYACWLDYLRYVEGRLQRMRCEAFRIVRLDIKNFYNNVRRDAVIAALLPGLIDAFNWLPGFEKTVASLFDPETPRRPSAIVDYLCDSSFGYRYWSPADGNIQTSPPDRGLPQGPDLSAYLANITLFSVDQAMTDAIEALQDKTPLDPLEGRSTVTGVYARYVDDILLAVPASGDLIALQNRLQDQLARVGLELSLDKTEPLGLMTFPQAQAWLTEQRGAGIAGSGPLRDPEDVSVVSDSDLWLGTVSMDRKAALGLLHSARLDSPELVGSASARGTLDAALAGDDLRHGDWIVVAKILWFRVAQTEPPTPQDGAAAFVAEWNSTAAKYPATTEFEKVAPVIVWLEALDRVLVSQSHRAPTKDQQERDAIATSRESLARLVRDGLVGALVSLLTLDQDTRQAFDKRLKGMVHLQELAIFWRAAQVLGLDAPVPVESAASSPDGVVWMYELGRREQSVSGPQALASSFDGVGDDNRAILLWTHLVVACLSWVGQPERGPALPVIETLAKHWRTRTPAHPPSEPAEVLDVILAPDATWEDTAEHRRRCATAMTALFSTAGVKKSMELLASNGRLKEFVANGHNQAIPLLPGVSRQALFLMSESADRATLDVTAVCAGNDSQSESLSPKVDWGKMGDLPVGPATLHRFEAHLPSTNRLDSRQVDPERISADDLHRTSRQIRALLEVTRSFRSIRQTTCLVPIASNLIESTDGNKSVDLVADEVASLDVGDTAFVRVGTSALARKGISSIEPEIWRIGVAMTDLVLGAHAVTNGLESLRLAPGPNSDGSAARCQWARTTCARYGLALLRGPEALLRRWGTLPTTDDGLPIVLDRVLRRMAGFPAGDDVACEAKGVAQVLCMLTEGRALQVRNGMRVDIGLPGAASSMLAEIAFSALRRDVDFSSHLPAISSSPQPEQGQRRPAWAWMRCAKRLELAANDASTGDDQDTLRVLTAGCRVLAVTTQLRIQALEVLSLITASARLKISEADPDLGIWGLDETAFLHTEQDGSQLERASGSLLMLSTLKTVGCQADASVDGLSDITPLGWCVALGTLCGALPSAQRGVGLGSNSHGVVANALNTLGKLLATPGTDGHLAKPSKKPGEARRGRRMWEELDSLVPCLGENELETLWDCCRTLDDDLRLRVLPVESPDLSFRSRRGETIAFRGSDSRDRILARYQVGIAGISRRRDSRYEQLPPKTPNGPIEYCWTETWFEDRLLGVTILDDALARLAGVSSSPRPVPESQGTEHASCRDIEGRQRVDSLLEIGSVPLPAVPNADGATRSDGTEPETQSQEMVDKSSGSLPPERRTEPSQVSAEPPRGLAKGSGGGGSPSNDRSPAHDETPSKAQQELRRFQKSSWDSRSKTHPGLVRVAIFQFEVDESYRHPRYEICGESKTEPGYGRSCSEYRRRKLLTAVLGLCGDLKVDVLLLPELSIRPETAIWMKGELPQLAPGTAVWAGTFRSPPDYTDHIRQKFPGDILGDWATVVPVVVCDADEGPARILARRKKYPASGVGEWFNPPPRGSRLEPLYTRETRGRGWGAAASMELWDPRTAVTELVCSEAFLVTSPANLFPLADEMQKLRRVFHPLSDGTFKDAVNEVSSDLRAFAESTGLHNPPGIRRSIVLLPAMTSRAHDYVILGQAGMLSAALTTALCNAVCGKHGDGRSCFVGKDSWDVFSDGAGESSGEEPLGSPYHGYTPGIYRHRGNGLDGWLGKTEQAVVVADIEPVYMAEGRPRPQVLPSPLTLIAHVPVIERWKFPDPGEPTDRNERHDAQRASVRADCRCQREAKRSEDFKKGSQPKRRSRDLADRNSDCPNLIRRIVARLDPQRRIASTIDDPDRSDTYEMLEELTSMADDSRHLEGRACAYLRSASSLPANWPPPALLDWLYVRMEAGEDCGVEIEVPAEDGGCPDPDGRRRQG